ncbi:hypothetical protein [Stieleria varia]|uniref:YcxB-like protein domain-containing protein n=1 Tax=Stieleria varia TaxID=2528005 RepID=A0A5C6ASF2_9BACT|nr:hypothetical protein [Stieleria varia]TWU02347.1 hypothetical protein Pla52n_33970 [Stieleria varia]
MSESLNPYAAPSDLASTAAYSGDMPRRIDVDVTERHLRYAEKHYLLHWHSGRLTLLSILAIVGGSGLSIWLQVKNIVPLPITQSGLALVTALAYWSVVRHSKVKTRQQLTEHGILPGANCELIFNTDRGTISMVNSSGRYEWRAGEVDLCNTLDGLMVCPEPYLYVFVPKQTDFVTCDARGFRKQLTQFIASVKAK